MLMMLVPGLLLGSEWILSLPSRYSERGRQMYEPVLGRTTVRQCLQSSEFTRVNSVRSGEVSRKVSPMVMLELNLQRGVEVDGQPVEGRTLHMKGTA